MGGSMKGSSKGTHDFRVVSTQPRDPGLLNISHIEPPRGNLGDYCPTFLFVYVHV